MGVLAHIPPELPQIPDDEELIFLAGPIQGAPNWQKSAVELLEILEYENPQTLHVANPRRSVPKEKIDYVEQVSWEKQMLRRAARLGGIIFWLAQKGEGLPYEVGRAYAQTTRIEFGRALGWRDYDPTIRLSIGMQPGYIGNEKYYVHCADEQGLKIHTTMEDTIADMLGIES